MEHLNAEIKVEKFETDDDFEEENLIIFNNCEGTNERIAEHELKMEIKEEIDRETICDIESNMEIQEANKETICDNDSITEIKDEKLTADDNIPSSKSPKKITVENITFKTDKNGKINFYKIKKNKQKLFSSNKIVVKNCTQSLLLGLNENSVSQISEEKKTPKSNDTDSRKTDSELESNDLKDKLEDVEKIMTDAEKRNYLFLAIYNGLIAPPEPPGNKWGFHRIQKKGKKSLVYTELGFDKKYVVPQVRKLVIFDESLNAEMYIYDKLVLTKKEYKIIPNSNFMDGLTFFLQQVNGYNICRGGPPISKFPNLNPSYVVKDSSVLRAVKCKILIPRCSVNKYICNKCSRLEQTLKHHMQLIQE